MNKMELNQIRITVRSAQKVTLYVTTPTNKPLLMCIHGGPGLESNSMIPSLMELNSIFDLAFIDLRGHGKSDIPDNNDYSLDAYARDLNYVIAHFKNQYPVIGFLGHSFGGCVAIKAMSGFQTFNFGILVNAPFDSSWQKNEVPNAEAVKAENDFALYPTDKNYWHLMLSLRKTYFPELSEAEVKEIMKNWDMKAVPLVDAQKNIFPTLNLFNECKEIKIPCLIVGGDIDPLVRESHLKDMSKLISNSKFRSIQNAGHFPFLSKKKDFINIVSQWWETKEGVQS